MACRLERTTAADPQPSVSITATHFNWPTPHSPPRDGILWGESECPFFQLVPPWADTAAGGQISLSRFDAANPELEAQVAEAFRPYLPFLQINGSLPGNRSCSRTMEGLFSYRYLDGPYNPPSAFWGGGVVVTPSIFVRPADPFLGPAAPAEYFGGFGGRVDAAGMSITDVIDAMDAFASQADNNILLNNHYWRRQFVSRFGLYWPRGESKSPSTSRISFPLTRHIIAATCSDFKVEWSWDDGTGAINGFPQQPRLGQGVVNLPNQRWYPILEEIPEGPSDERFEPVFRTATSTLFQNDGLPTLAQGGGPIAVFGASRIFLSAYPFAAPQMTFPRLTRLFLAPTPPAVCSSREPHGQRFAGPDFI